MSQTKEILKKRFDNYETNFTGTILLISGNGGKDVNNKGYFSGNGGMDVNNKGYFCLETD
jgi:hypothetical protein